MKHRVPNLRHAITHQGQGKRCSRQPALRPLFDSVRWSSYQGFAVEPGAAVSLSDRWFPALRFRHATVTNVLHLRQSTHGRQIAVGTRFMACAVAIASKPPMAAGD